MASAFAADADASFEDVRRRIDGGAAAPVDLAVDLGFEGSIVLGLLGGYAAGLVGGILISIPAMIGGELMSMPLFAAVGVLSAPPTIRFIVWRRRARNDGAYSIPADEVAWVRRFMVVEIVVFAFIPLFAAAMVRVPLTLPSTCTTPGICA